MAQTNVDLVDIIHPADMADINTLDGETLYVNGGKKISKTALLSDISIDEDNMVSNSDTKLPTQQSVKAYVDANSGGGSSLSYVALTSGDAIFNIMYAGPAVPVLTSSGVGTYTLTIPDGTYVNWINAKCNTSTLNGSNEFIVKYNNVANSFPRRLSVEYNGNNGALLNPFDFSMNYTQTVAANETTIVIPNGNALGSNGFWIILN